MNCALERNVFAIGIVHFCQRAPMDWIVRTLGDQLLRSGSSVAANYRSACRGRSDREFCAKIGIVADEADETLLWLELLQESTPAIHGAVHQQALPGGPRVDRDLYGIAPDRANEPDTGNKAEGTHQRGTP